jgi:hypothetical protein
MHCTIPGATCIAATALTLAVAQGAAQQAGGCFAGTDFTGQPVRMELVAEQIGELFEIYGILMGPGIGSMQLKADGWSGVGRLFRGHEFEADALYIQLSDFTGTSVVLTVEGYGTVPFSAIGC